MSPHHSTFQLSLSVCFHLVCLLLVLADSSSQSSDDPLPANIPTTSNTTQPSCSTACDNSTQDLHSPPNSPLSINLTSSSNNLSGNVTSMERENNSSTASPSTRLNSTQSHSTAPPSHQNVTEQVTPLPSNTTGSSPKAPPTGSVNGTSTVSSTASQPGGKAHTTMVPTTSQPGGNLPTTTVLLNSTVTTTTSVPTITKPTAAPHHLTTAKAEPKLTSAHTKLSASLTTTQITGMATVQINALPIKPTSLNTTTPANHSEPAAAGTEVGAVLTMQLGDTASLLAVLVFGLLFFLVTVFVFVTQAYESYRRKDYTQVDYLINGMYADSGV